MFVILAPQLTPPAVSLRAKVSHSWLDHEITMVPTSLALDRWRSRTWKSVEGRWHVLHELAQELGRSLGDFSAASLVDRLPAFNDWDLERKTDLKEALNRVHNGQPGNAALRGDYSAYLEELWRCACGFFRLIDNPAATQEDVERSWDAVSIAGAKLKALFTSRRIPEGVVVP